MLLKDRFSDRRYLPFTRCIPFFSNCFCIPYLPGFVIGRSNPFCISGFASTFTYSFCLLLSTFAPSLLFSAFSSFDDLLSALDVCNCFSSLLLLSVYAPCILQFWIFGLRGGSRGCSLFWSSSLCLYNNTKKTKNQDGKLAKIDKMVLCRIQKSANEGQMGLTSGDSF